MATGGLTIEITNARGGALSGKLHIELEPHAQAIGGDAMEVSFDVSGHKRFEISNISCHDGPGTLYAFRLTADGYRPYSFFQLMKPRAQNLASEARVRLMTNPKAVSDITAAGFKELPPTFRRALESAVMVELTAEDRDLVGLSGSALYDAMGPMRKASLLNLVAKGLHSSSERIASFVRSPAILRQDRCFAEVDPALHAKLSRADMFKSAPGALHKPPAGFALVDSFKSRDSHANLQVTFMRKLDSDILWADIDIDEASGFEHGFEVIRNAVVDGRTNPYLVRELLLLALDRQTIDPGYDFVFR
ncbi:MAG: hypothetical protein ABIS29_01285 [Vicinamibacterales bacterium]